MIKQNQNGSIGATVSIVLLAVFLIGALGFGGWAYMSRQDYKDNVDEKISAAVTVAKQEEGSKKDKEFLEKEKEPLRLFTGPQAYGSLSISYPKTWSGLVDDKGNGSALVDGYFYPAIVPSITGDGSTFALRVQVVSRSYSDVLNSLKGQQANKQKPITVTPYALPKVPNIVGVRVDGNITNTKTGSMVILPLRSETIYLWTEGDAFKNDFNNIILPNFTFAP